MAIKNRFININYKKRKNHALTPGLCALCGIVSDESYLGQLFTTTQISVHEHCLMFSPLLNQIYNPDKKRKGFIIGFKITDIQREVKRIIPLKCRICRGPRAGIGCYTSNCRKSFHLCCGLKNSAMGIFKDGFQFYCSDHCIPQDLNKQMKLCERIVPECTICLESLVDEGYEESPGIKIGNNWAQLYAKVNSRTVIHGLCCSRCWMHRGCTRKYALSAGLHHVKCPNCTDKKIFIDTIQKCGIWLPDRDASWELEPGAYRELYEDPNRSSEQIDELIVAIDSQDTPNIIIHSPRVLLTDALSQPTVLSTHPPLRKRARPSNWSSVSSPTKPIKRKRASTGKFVEKQFNKCLKCNKNIVSVTSSTGAVTRGKKRNMKVRSTARKKTKMSDHKVRRCLTMLQEGIPQWKIATLLRCSAQNVSRIKMANACVCNDKKTSVETKIGDIKTTTSYRKRRWATVTKDQVESCLSLLKQGVPQVNISSMLKLTQQKVSKIKLNPKYHLSRAIDPMTEGSTISLPVDDSVEVISLTSDGVSLDLINGHIMCNCGDCDDVSMFR